MSKTKGRASIKPILFIVIVFLLATVLIARYALTSKTTKPTTDQIGYTVTSGPLIISVTESGTIMAREQVILKSEMAGKSSILTLVEEGEQVKKGDLLIELDASTWEDKKIDQQIRVQNAEASFINARENLEITKNQALSDVDKAKLTYMFAKQDLSKYLEGEYPNQLREAEAKITLAKEDVTRARNNLKWSKTLFDEKYLSQSELDADELAVKKKALDLELEKNNLDLLKNYTYKRRVAQLESDVKQAKMALERTNRKANANVVQGKANLEAKEAEFKRQKTKLENIEDMIAKSKIYAPTDGLVIYASSAQGGSHRRRSEPLQEGQEVRERQELIYLPTTSSSKAEVAIHETSLNKVYKGLPARITVDALPGKVFTGKVARIAPLPDAQSAFLNPDLKVYKTDIYLDNNSALLRTGMSCKVEIFVEKHKDTIYVPIQSVIRVNNSHTVYTINETGIEPRTVKIGLDNNRVVRIISGLVTGERVTLTPPLAAASVSNAVTLENMEDMPEIPSEQKKAKEEGNPTKNGQIDQAKNKKGSDEGKGALSHLSPEQKKAMREKLKTMSPEDRKAYIEKMRGQNG